MDWCSHEAAKFAVMRWHYSRAMPAAMRRIGVWENGRFVGAVLYGHGSGGATDGRKYGFDRTGHIAELTRVALAPNRKNPTSKVVARSIKMVSEAEPGLKMLISFADYAGQEHTGTIYQAGNWYYIGAYRSSGNCIIHGKEVHPRTVSEQYKSRSISYLKKHVDPDAYYIDTLKHRYAYPLCNEAHDVLERIKQPYPKKLQAQEV